MTKIDFKTVIPKFDEVLSRGLSRGLGSQNGQMCIEAAICYALGLSHGDNPDCVTSEIKQYKIRLNDSNRWLSPESRAKALRNLGIAQLGSAGIVDGREFLIKLSTKHIQVLIPTLFREIFPKNKVLLQLALNCENNPTIKSAYAAANAAAAVAAAAAAVAAAAAYAADAAAYAADAAAYAADAAAYAADADAEKYLILSANLALEVLQELKSPGCEWINFNAK